MDAPSVAFVDDPAEFLAAAGEWLARDPVTATVVATVAQREAAAIAQGRPLPDAPFHWYAVVRDPAGEIVGVAMRTAPFAPYPPYLLPMPDAAAAALAAALLARGEEVGGANGALPATQVLVEAIAQPSGAAVTTAMHTRLFELGELVEPRPTEGRLRPVRLAEAPLALEWTLRFFADADEQAGRPPGTHAAEGFTVADAERKIGEGTFWFWVDDTDRPVHLTGANPPAYGVARIGPVYTPVELRGRGYASAAVAEVSRLLRDGGARVTLFTDQANPTSNGIYVALGYRPVVDTIELRVGVREPTP